MSEREHWTDCALNHGGTACDMGPDCGKATEKDHCERVAGAIYEDAANFRSETAFRRFLAEQFARERQAARMEALEEAMKAAGDVADAARAAAMESDSPDDYVWYEGAREGALQSFERIRSLGVAKETGK